MNTTGSKFATGQTNKSLGKSLNLTMAHVNRHETMLYELDSKLMVLNRTLQSVMVQLSYF